MVKKNTNKKSDFVKDSFVNDNKNSLKYEFNKSIKKSKGFEKPEYLEKSFYLKSAQFDHKKSMDFKNFSFKVYNADKNRELAKYRIDQKIGLEREKYNKDLAFKKERFNTEMSMNIKNEAAKMVEAKKQAKKDALKSIWHGFFGHRF